MGTLLRRALVKLASCCCSCCLCACCEVREEASGSDSEKELCCGARGEQQHRQPTQRRHGQQHASELTGAVSQQAPEHRRASRQQRSGHATLVPETPSSNGTALFGSPAAKKNRDLADVAGSLSGSSRPSLPLNSAEEQAPLAEELQAAVAMAMRNSAINACFRASHPSRVTALRRRGQQAWRRAMRAGGPFAPGSVVGAVAAANHRRSCGHPLAAHAAAAEAEQAAASISSTPTPAGVLSPTANAVQPGHSSAAAARQLSLGRHSEGFMSVPSLAATSVRSVAHANAAGHDPQGHAAADTSPAMAEAEAEPPLGRLSCASQVSNASSSYFSVLSHDARQAFTSAGVRTIGGHLNTSAASCAASGSQGHTPHAPSPSAAAAAASSQGSSHHHHHHHTQHHHAHHHHVYQQRHSQQRSAGRSHVSTGMASAAGSLGEQGPFQHSSHPAVEAFRANQLGFGFSGGGFLFPWHLGVVTELKDMGIINDSTHLAGASCGAIIVSCVNAGMDLHGLVDKLLEFADDCRTHGTAGRLRYVIEHFMTKELPADAHVRCSGRTHLQLTRVFPYLKVTSVSDFHSKEDLVSAIATSSHIPAYNDGSLVARFRNGLYIDGGVLRHLPVPPRVAFSAGVSCVPLKFLNKLPGANRLSVLRHLAISPDLFQDFPYDWQQLASLVLVPAPDPVLLSMIEHGKRDARTWASATGLTAWLNGTLFVPMQPSAEHTGMQHGGQGSRQLHGQQGDRSQPRRQQGQAWHATAAETISRLGLSGTAALGSMAAVGSISEYLWAAAASVTGSGAAAAAAEAAGPAAQPIASGVAADAAGRLPSQACALGGPGAGARAASQPVQLEVSGAQLERPVAWSAEHNAFVAHVVAAKAAGCEQAVVRCSDSTCAVEHQHTHAPSAAAPAVEAISATPAVETASGQRFVTIRIKGQAPGAPDTVVTVEVS